MHPPGGPHGYPHPAPHQQTSGQTTAAPSGRSIALVLGLAVLVMVFTMGGIFLLGNEGGRYFASGARVTPSPDERIVFVRDEDLSGRPPSAVRCTATTDAGQRLGLAPPEEVITVARGSRPARKYRSVAELPTDRGSLTVTCASIDGARLLLAKPDSWSMLWLFVAGYWTLIGVMVLVVWVMRRKHRRQQPFSATA